MKAGVFASVTVVPVTASKYSASLETEGSDCQEAVVPFEVRTVPEAPIASVPATPRDPPRRIEPCASGKRGVTPKVIVEPSICVVPPVLPARNGEPLVVARLVAPVESRVPKETFPPFRAALTHPVLPVAVDFTQRAEFDVSSTREALGAVIAPFGVPRRVEIETVSKYSVEPVRYTSFHLFVELPKS